MPSFTNPKGSTRSARGHRLKARSIIRLSYACLFLLFAALILAYWKLSVALDEAAQATRTGTTNSVHQLVLNHPYKNPRKHKPSSCAILLFGLPRAFRDYVLPSLDANVVRPNARYACDYFVHSFVQDREEAGRSGRGGAIRSEDVLLLRGVVEQRHQEEFPTAFPWATPVVSFVSDTNETFWDRRGAAILKYRTAKNPDGNYTYFPWAEPTYEYPKTLDNIVKQWHSVQAAWEAMEEESLKKDAEAARAAQPALEHARPVPVHHHYRRVALVRNDVVFVTPIDIYATATHATTDPKAPGDDYEANAVAVIPNFAKYPVNDRLIYGPYDAVKVWAAQRFRRIDDYARDPAAVPGMVMHSETFLNASILQTIQETKIVRDSSSLGDPETFYTVAEDPGMCFLRVRADGAVWIEDCDPKMSGFGGGYPGGEKEYVKLLRPFLPRNGKGCRKRRLRDKLRRILELACPKA